MASGNSYTLAALATTGVHSIPEGGGPWTLQHRHPDGDKWLVIGHFPTKDLALEASKAFVTANYGPEEDFRVKRTKAPAD
jgi:hypothetical protein